METEPMALLELGCQRPLQRRCGMCVRWSCPRYWVATTDRTWGISLNFIRPEGVTAFPRVWFWPTVSPSAAGQRASFRLT